MMYMSEKKYDYKKAISTYKHAFNGILFVSELLAAPDVLLYPIHTKA